MGSRQAANLRRAGFDLTVYNRTRSTADAWAREHGARVAATPARGRPARRRRDLDGRRRRSGRGGPARRARRRRPRSARGRALRRHVDDRADADARHRRAAGRARRRVPRRARHGLGPQGGRRHAHHHGRRRGGRLRARAAAARGDGQASCSTSVRSARARWSSSSTTRWPRSTASWSPRPCWWDAGPGSTSPSSSRSWARDPVARRCCRLKAGPMLDARLRAAVQARAHAQGRPALPRGGSGRRGPLPRRGGARASSTPPGCRATSPAPTSPRSSRSSRGSPAPGCSERPISAKTASICSDVWKYWDIVHSM